jgi:phage host-nuclease inhibitor protein Gam
MARRKKSIAAFPSPGVPRNEAEANLAIAIIADAQHQCERLKGEMNACIADVTAAYEEAARPFRDAVEKTLQGLRTYCETNRERLPRRGRARLRRFAAGEVAWRPKTPRVVVRDALKACVWFAKCEFGRFIRVNEELDHEAILKEPLRAAGNPYVAVCSRGEEFSVTPFATMIEEARPIERP